MKNASFRQKLLTSFLAIGILPLLICTLLMLNIFRLSLTRSAADAAETQLDAMSGELSGLLSDCETVMEKLCAEPAVAAALDRSELDEQRVYSVLYRAAAPVLGGASLSVYGADGRQLYSTSSQPASGSLSPRWGLLAAAADGGVVYRGASSKSSACIQAACAVRRGSVPLGYVVADVTAAQLTALFDGQHTAIGAATRGIDKIPVLVVEAADLTDRASAFVGHNPDRPSPTATALMITSSGRSRAPASVWCSSSPSP